MRAEHWAFASDAFKLHSEGRCEGENGRKEESVRWGAAIVGD